MNERTKKQMSLQGSVGQGRVPYREGGQSFLGSCPLEHQGEGRDTKEKEDTYKQQGL